MCDFLHTVQASKELNKKLSYTTHHQQCQLNTFKQDLEVKIKELKDSRIELDQKPNDMHQKYHEKKEKAEILQQQLQKVSLC